MKKNRVSVSVIVIGLFIGLIVMVGVLGVKDISRIPQKEIGTDMYALEAEVREILGQECVAVSTDTGIGSGFLWLNEDKELWVVTAGHLVSGSQNGELELWSGQKAEFSAKDVEVYPEIDLAVIKTDALKKKNVKAVFYEPDLQMQVGDTVWLLDSIYGPASGIQSGAVYGVKVYLENYAKEMLLLSGKGTAGMSGCPIYDENGRIVAMMSGMNEDGTILAAVPFEDMVKYLEDVKP